jgi:pimeloyl-ACP methyl ester carboxylesterase
VGRIFFLIVLLALLAAVIWAAVIHQRIPLVETVSLDSVETQGQEIVDGVTINVSDLGEGVTPVFLLHDVDIAGSAIFSDLAASLGSGVRVVEVDLPGFGLSTRLPGENPGHTVADMADKVSAVIEARSDVPIVLLGVGLGGLALDRALEELASFDAQQCRVVELKFFAGLTIEETAAALDVSAATVEREWVIARAWLYQRLADPMP